MTGLQARSAPEIRPPSPIAPRYIGRRPGRSRQLPWTACPLPDCSPPWPVVCYRQPVDGRMRTMRVVVVGCGRLGAELARSLASEGHGVTVVDEDMAAFERLGADFPGKQVHGTGFDEDVLREAQAGEADLV